MRYGIDVPNFGDFGNPRALADLAREAEEAGWDGFFLWDDLQTDQPVPFADPWVALAAIAAQTQRILLGRNGDATAAPSTLEIGPRDGERRSAFWRAAGAGGGHGRQWLARIQRLWRADR